MKNFFGRHPRGGEGPDTFGGWIPAFAGMTALLLLFGCGPTYKKETLKESVKELAKKEYKLDVEVQQAGKTLGIRFKVKNLLSELYSGDESIYKKMNGLFTVLVRVVLSADEAPDFIVLEILDEENPKFKLVFTRYVEDLRKSMAEALSYTQTQDRLLEEFVVGDRHVPFDPQEMDLVRLMMMAMDSSSTPEDFTPPPFELEEVRFKDFVGHVVENTMRRMLRERKDVNKQAVVREVNAMFDQPRDANGHMKIMLDMVSKPSVSPPPLFLEKTVLPFVAEEVAKLFKSYRFHDFAGITVIEKNSGKMLTVTSQ